VSLGMRKRLGDGHKDFRSVVYQAGSSVVGNFWKCP
jgi:hypothetical protein